MRLTLLTIAILISTIAFSQNPQISPRKYGNIAFKINPLYGAFAGGKGSIEFKTSESTSFEFAGDVIPRSVGTTYSISPNFRYYFDKTSLEGHYAAIFLRYRSLRESSLKIDATSVGFKSGKQWLLGKADRFVLDFSIGLRYAFHYDKVWASESLPDDELEQFFFDLVNNGYDLYFGGLRPEGRFAIGYRF